DTPMLRHARGRMHWPRWASRHVRGKSSVEGSWSRQTMEYLRHPSAQGEVYLVGTSHISSESATEVQKVVKAVMPQHVMVELCDARRGRLEAQRAKPESCSILPGSVFEAGGPEGPLAFVKMFYELLRSAGLDPGQDMLAGLEAGREVGARLHCGDVEGRITEERIKAEFMASNLQELFFTLSRPEVQHEASQIFPDLPLDLATLMRGQVSGRAAAAFADAAEQMKDRDK
ncbi:Uncharacterized protein SCF082_LOCUS10592, partial [Durusdinium trenchii]